MNFPRYWAKGAFGDFSCWRWSNDSHEDAAALAGRMAWCAGHADFVRALRGDCRRAAEAATWEAYRRRLAARVEEILEAPMEDKR